MNSVNHVVTSVFDVLLRPFETFGAATALIVVSGVFGILALVAFKFISYQKGIKFAKDKIKAHLIEIRIYQDDLVVVTRAIGSVLLRNFQYMAYNFGPFLPLAIPFTLVIAQLVVRYAFAPVPVAAVGAERLPGEGTTLEVALLRDRAALVEGLRIEYPPGVTPVSPLVRVPSEGRAFQEFVATSAGTHELQIVLADGSRETKLLAAGETSRLMQPERGRGFISALLWPAEDTFTGSSPFERIAFTYPDRDLGWLPGGTGGVLLIFLVASMVFGVLALKPLRIQI
jgi:hypothetical protein